VCSTIPLDESRRGSLGKTPPPEPPSPRSIDNRIPIERIIIIIEGKKGKKMRIALLFLALGTATEVALAARSSGPGRSSSAASHRSSSSHSPRGGRGGGRSSSSSSGRRRSPIVDDVDDDDDDFDVEEDYAEDDAMEDDDDAGEYDDYDGERSPSPPARSSRRGSTAPPPRRASPSPPSRGGRVGSGRPSPAAFDYDEDDYDDHRPPRRGDGVGERRGNPSSSRGGGGRSGSRRGPTSPSSSSPPPRRVGEGRVVSYKKRGPPPPSTFTRGLSAIRDRMPDPNAVKDTVLHATKAAQERTAQLTSNVYREMKGLTSSELEQVMLKATRPDNEPVKSKHVERLVGVTYQISGKYDIYDAVLRKLWNKMAERDIRTKLKSVYVLHRFSVDGGPEHQEALKQRLRALRKTKDPKRSTGGRGGTRYFDSKVLIGVDNDVSSDFLAFSSSRSDPDFPSPPWQFAGSNESA
jgi:hypothetical protein